MNVGVVTDFEMTFTGDLFQTAWQNNDFDFKVSIPQRKIGHGPLKNSRKGSRAILFYFIRCVRIRVSPPLFGMDYCHDGIRHY